MSNISFQSFSKKFINNNNNKNDNKNERSISNSNSLKSTKFLPNNNNNNSMISNNNNNLNNISTITLNPQINNNLFQNQNKIQYFCHSVDKKKYSYIMENLFNNPNKFLEFSFDDKYKYIIGKKPSNIKNHNFIPLIQTNINNNSNILRSIKTIKKTTKLKNIFLNKYNLFFREKKKINENDLNEIYFKLKNNFNEKYNKKINDNYNIINMNKENIKFHLQKITLKNLNKLKNSEKKLNKRLIKKSHKNSSENLLINKSQNYRIKNEILNYLEKENKKIKELSFIEWKNSLREINNNNNNESNIELKNNNEIIRNPNKKDYLKNLLLKNKNNLILKKVNSVDLYDIKLKGNNLLDFEFDIAKNIKGKKVINKFLYANEITKNLNFTKNNFNKNKS